MFNKKGTKHALLMSVLSLLLCCSMLIGTTFAWFTDEVKTNNNIIKSGNLDVELYWSTNAQTWSKVDENTNVFSATLWEPGHTQVVYLKVVNEGTLALEYKLGVNVYNEIGSTNVEGNEFKLSEHIQYGIKTVTGAYADRDAARKAVADISTKLNVPYTSAENLELYPANTEGKASEAIVAMVVYMPETVGNEANYDKAYNPPVINLGINLFATQLTHENDSYGSDYDDGAYILPVVYTAEELKSALENGKSVKLGKNIELTEAVVIPAGVTVTIDLNGKEIKGAVGRDANNNRVHTLVNNGTLTLVNGTVISAGEDGGSAIYNEAGATLTIKNVMVYGAPLSNPVYPVPDWPSYGINNYGTMTVDGATIKTYHGAIATGGNGVTVINDADIDVGQNTSTGITSYAIYSFGDAQVTVNGGNFAFTKHETYVNGGHTFCELGTNPIIVNGGNYIGTSFSTGADREYVIKGGTFDADPSAYVASDYHAVENNGVYYVVPADVDNVITSNTELQAALDAAAGDTTIILAADINGDVTVSQKEGVNIVIDGKNYKYDGTIYIDGKARHTGAETLTIKNINFETANDGVDFISANIAKQYAHNVTIEGCTFTNKGEGTVVPARFRQAYNITMKNCIVEGTFSPLWTTGVKGLTINNVIANCKDEGMTIGASDNVLIENCTITVPGAASFGIRTDATAGYKLTVNNCTLNVATPIVIRGSSDTYTVTVDGGKYVSTTEELINAIKNAPVGSTTTIIMAGGTYDGDIDITVAALGQSGGDVVIKAMEGAKPVITGTVTLGYRNQGVGATMYNANVTFEGITFDHAAASSHSLNIQDVKSLTLKNCTVIGENEYGITCARGNGTGTSKIVGCTFENAGLQLLGNYATGLVIEGCTFNNSCINVQAGNGVTVQGCIFNSTLTDANNNESFYVIRSNSTPITVTGCTINIDSTVTGIGVAHATKGWGVFVNRGTTTWTVSDVQITLTEAAQLQTALEIAKCTSTGAINMTNVTVNGVQQ